MQTLRSSGVLALGIEPATLQLKVKHAVHENVLQFSGNFYDT